jgi:hypothetical protein
MITGGITAPCTAYSPLTQNTQPFMVVDAGFEPATDALSRHCSTAELIYCNWSPLGVSIPLLLGESQVI